MYLKEIEIQGFKSFADKTKVVFDQGVTAVVGPNGSGKSNITENLRWALGESSVKSLRGGKMPDVIFTGTESRKPLNYASVIVTLDNEDGFIKDAGQVIKQTCAARCRARSSSLPFHRPSAPARRRWPLLWRCWAGMRSCARCARGCAKSGGTKA